MLQNVQREAHQGRLGFFVAGRLAEEGGGVRGGVLGVRKECSRSWKDRYDEPS